MILEIIQEKIDKILDELGYEKTFKIVKSNRPDLCDYQYDGVFKLASINHTSPIEIGEKIAEKINELDDFSNYFERIEFVKPGFINITISFKLINNILRKMNNEEKFGIKSPEKKQTYFLDYGGPNIAKPLHVGHMRTAIVGESIKRIIRYMGHNTICDVHLGDFGLQIGQVIYGLKENGILPSDITLEILEQIYPKYSSICKVNDEVKENCAKITKDLQDGNIEYVPYWEKICEISGNDIKRLYRYLDVSFDLWYGESDSYKYIGDVEKLVKKKNLLTESEGAKVIDVSSEFDSKEVPPLIFQKSNKAYLYGTTDLATIYQRVKDYNPDYILYVVDNRQELHFKQVFRAVEKIGFAPDLKLEFLGYGTVNGEDGKPYKTRSGDAPKLDDLFNEVKEIFISKKDLNEQMSIEDQDKITNAILKFADLQNNREKDYIFDIAKFSEVVGKTGPYILYTYLRINKIIKDYNITELGDEIYNEYDRDLRKKMIELDLSLESAFKLRLPSQIADYIYDLCVNINAFYQNNYINNLEDKEKKNNWIYVLTLSNKILKQMLDLLVIDIPSIM